MLPLKFICLLAFVSVVTSAATEPPKKSRVIDDDLSKASHEEHGAHNPKYDRDALFGNGAEEISDLPPEETSKKIGNLYDRMDVNKKGYLTQEELAEWVRQVHRSVMAGDMTSRWKEFDLDPSKPLTWEAYEKHAVKDDGEYGGEDEATKKANLARDKRRWNAIDTSSTGSITFAQAGLFFTPEAHPEMHDILVQETIEEMDKNKDGFIDIQEYIDDLWKSEPNEPKPDWVKTEEEHFINSFDLNHDGKLDAAEVKKWIFAEGHDHSESEAKHLMTECDKNKDGQLTKEEMQNCRELFINSSATNYGQIFSQHDEL